jgi:chaperonin cofactor prefoldin
MKNYNTYINSLYEKITRTLEQEDEQYEKKIRTLEHDEKIIKSLNEDADKQIKNNPIYN